MNHIELLKKEGLKENEITINQPGYYTIETLDGFFTWHFEQGVPSLQHFLVVKEKRNTKTARELIKKFLSLIKTGGFTQCIIHCRKDNQRLIKLINYYFKTKPYAEKDNLLWFLMEVK